MVIRSPRSHESIGLLAWLDHASDERGVHFAVGDGTWEFWTYRRLAEYVERVAFALHAFGVCQNDVVSIVQESGAFFLATFFGVLRAGGVPSPVAPPQSFQDDDG